MRLRPLALTIATVFLVPLWALRAAQQAGESPHGNLRIDCTECHTA